MFGMVWRGCWHFWCDVLNVLMPWLVLFATTFRFVLYFLAALLVFVDAGFCSFRHDDWYFLTRCLVPFDTVVGAFWRDFCYLLMRCLFTLAPASTSEGHSVRRSGADSELLDNDFGWGSFSDNLREDVSNNYRFGMDPVRNGSQFGMALALSECPCVTATHA